MSAASGRHISAIGVSGSTSASSRSRTLVEHALSQLRALGARTAIVDLNALSSDGLLARAKDPRLDESLALVGAARILVVGTPVYRATYTGQLKCFFDLLPRDALAGSISGLVMTGYGDGHRLAIDHGLRPLVASLGGLTASRSIFVVDAEMPDVTVVPQSLDDATKLLAEQLWQVVGGHAARGW